MASLKSIVNALKFRLKPLPFHNSYFPEKPHKSKFRQRLELLGTFLKYGEIEQYYYMYGFDCADKYRSEYIDYHSFRKLRDYLNQRRPYNYICFLRDKKLFSFYALANGIPAVGTLGVIREGKLESSESGDILALCDRYRHLFCKPSDDMCGNGVFRLDLSEEGYLLNDKPSSAEEIDSFVSSLKGEFLIQKRIVQHPEISRIYPKAINTLRIVTVNKNSSSDPDDVVVLSSMLRVGAFGNIMDNWSKGGLIIKIEEDGSLADYGFHKPAFGTRADKHPDTGFVFSGTKIPYFKEAVAMAKKYHSVLNHVHSIGWDISINEDGPIFIEGNDNWELGIVQICEGGIRAQVESLFK